jgi:cytochrome c oxidase assembly protein subunit 11
MTSLPETPARSHRRVATMCVSIVAGMVALSFASVPLYRLFCQVTGFGGTTQVAEEAPVAVLDRPMTVQFDANVGPGLAFRFEAVQREETMRIGEQSIAYYEVSNPTDKPLVGTAVFNVVPHKAGIYFNKIECFCFTEQKLAPGESARLPVAYFIDPAIAEDEDLKTLKSITLSYTFYPAKASASLEDASAASPPVN